MFLNIHQFKMRLNNLNLNAAEYKINEQLTTCVNFVFYKTRINIKEETKNSELESQECNIIIQHLGTDKHLYLFAY